MRSSTRGFVLLLALAFAGGFIRVGTPVGGVANSDGAGSFVPASDQPVEPGGPSDPDANEDPVGEDLPPSGAGRANDSVAAPTSQLSCAAGRNGGATDRGVSGNSIQLASTVVQDGPAASLLEPAILGMKAVVDKVNRGGGICGRLLNLTVVNDSFRSDLGQQYIRNFVNSDVFALPVVPSAEGLSAAIATKDIARAGIPVVGTDGMRVEQYEDPWVWPSGTATISTMRIMASYGYHEQNARTFAIIWDSRYKFGIEGRDAFRAQVQAMGGTIVHDQDLDPSQASYASEVQEFNRKCGNNACDMVAMLLLPDAAMKWMVRQPVRARLYTAGAQTLFTDQFAQSCAQEAGVLCDGLSVWTGYNPPIGALQSLPGVDQYVKDVRALSPRADVRNQFLQGAYLGMSVFVEALRKVGPNLTRERLRAALDSMNYKSDLASTLSWTRDNRAANTRAKAFSVVVSQGSFVGWRDERTNWVQDPLQRR